MFIIHLKFDMKKTVGIMVCGLALLMLASCQTKQSAINDLRSLQQEIAINGGNYSVNDWKKAGEEYYNVNQKLKKHMGEYSDAEVQEISELNGKCVRSFTEGAVTKVAGAANALKSFLNGFMK